MATDTKLRTHSPKNHHHVPRFLLAPWAGADGKVAVYVRRSKGIVVNRLAPKNTAFEPHLYSLPSLPEEDREFVEIEIMSKAIDGPAALVHSRLLKGELDRLGSDERSTWTRFLQAQWWRDPATIARMRADSRAVLTKALEDRPEEYLAIKGDAKEGTLLDWVDKHSPCLHELIALGRVLPKLINDDRAGNIIINMRWEVLNLDGAPDLLISDRPAIRFEGLHSRNCLIMLPISPTRLFVASGYDRGFADQDRRKITKAANRSTVQSAMRRVYGTGPHHMPLVAKLLQNAGANTEWRAV